MILPTWPHLHTRRRWCRRCDLPGRDDQRFPIKLVLWRMRMRRRRL